MKAADLVRLRNQYRSWSTEDLVRVVTRSEDYRPEAVQVVRELLADRDQTEIARLTRAVQRERQEQARGPLGTILDPPYRGTALAAFGAWLAFMVGLSVDRTVDSPVSFGVAAAVSAAIVALGFAAASCCRSLPQRSNAHRARLVFLSLGVGAGAGLVNLAANWGIAEAAPALRAALVQRIMGIPPWAAVVAAPLQEEVLRLVVMSVIAWVVYRLTERAGLAFAFALVGSAVIAKYTVLGVVQGYINWRWGLPYAIIGHSVGNATHLALQWLVF